MAAPSAHSQPAKVDADAPAPEAAAAGAGAEQPWLQGLRSRVSGTNTPRASLSSTARQSLGGVDSIHRRMSLSLRRQEVMRSPWRRLLLIRRGRFSPVLQHAREPASTASHEGQPEEAAESSLHKGRPEKVVGRLSVL